MPVPENDKARALIDDWECAKAEHERLQQQCHSASARLSNATNAVGKALMPPGQDQSFVYIDGRVFLVERTNPPNDSFRVKEETW